MRYPTNIYTNSSTHQCSFDEFDKSKHIKCDDFVYKTHEVTILNEVSKSDGNNRLHEFLKQNNFSVQSDLSGERMETDVNWND